MVSFRPLSRSVSLASRATLISSTPSIASRQFSSRAAGLANSSKLGSFTKPRLMPSSIRTLTTAREKVKVLLVLYDGGKHAQEVSVKFPFPLSRQSSIYSTSLVPLAHELFLSMLILGPYLWGPSSSRSKPQKMGPFVRRS